MNDLMPAAPMPHHRPSTPHGPIRADSRITPNREHTMSLIEEVLARSHQVEAQRQAAEHRRARQLTAGRQWARLAAWAQRRAERARTRAS
ncbi:hypothetical protein WIS52_13395 [Pseudonocardia nematodicida]|uniref:Uncharacterized protein n=1 Tax=Pseudonocardia nematodicida TaxID=1206997 RepID=A0ABV1KAG6_9PSEU